MPKPKILLLTAGGSIVNEPKSQLQMQPVPLDTERLYEVIPDIGDLAEVTVKEVFREDSENFTHEQWTRLAQEVNSHLDEFDGFVITTGDTLPYTAAALAFAMQHVNKPIVMHGDGVSVFEEDSYGRDNILDAVIAACNNKLAGVYVVSDNKLLWGTRINKLYGRSKCHINVVIPPVGSFTDGELSLDEKLVSSDTKNSYMFTPHFDPGVAMIKIYPGFDPDYLFYLLLSKQPKAVLLLGYTSGCLPNRGNQSLIPFLNEARQRHIPVFAASTAFHPRTNLRSWVMGNDQLEKYDVVATSDMTYYSAMVKLMWIAHQTTEKEEMINLFYKPVAQEITPL